MPDTVPSTLCVLTHWILPTNDEVSAIITSKLEMGKLTGSQTQEVWLPWSPPSAIPPRRGGVEIHGSGQPAPGSPASTH